VDLAWIPPELREFRDEFTLAASNKIPVLVTMNDIRGDLHSHTDWTDGRDSILSMAQAALARGYDYLAFTDHSKRVTIANGMDDSKILKYWAEIERIEDGFKNFRMLKGVEVDILDDGNLDLSDHVLKNADWVVAAVHYGQNQSRGKMTQRLLKAVSNPYVSALAHPSGRLFGSRERADIDYEKIFKAASDHGCALEINGQPKRLDLNDKLLEAACKYPVNFIVSSDAHSSNEFDYLGYAVDQARRGGLTSERILNTRDFIQKTKVST
jgi:DNA polymerase (family 10)